MVKNLPLMQETWIPSLAREDPLEKGIVTHSSILGEYVLQDVLENSTDRGTWGATVHRATKSRTWLSNFQHRYNLSKYLEPNRRIKYRLRPSQKMCKLLDKAWHSHWCDSPPWGASSCCWALSSVSRVHCPALSEQEGLSVRGQTYHWTGTSNRPEGMSVQVFMPSSAQF